MSLSKQQAGDLMAWAIEKLHRCALISDAPAFNHAARQLQEAVQAVQAWRSAEPLLGGSLWSGAPRIEQCSVEEAREAEQFIIGAEPDANTLTRARRLINAFVQARNQQAATQAPIGARGCDIAPCAANEAIAAAKEAERLLDCKVNYTHAHHAIHAFIEARNSAQAATRQPVSMVDEQTKINRLLISAVNELAQPQAHASSRMLEILERLGDYA